MKARAASHQEKRISTTEDWHSTAPDRRVKVYILRRTPDGVWRVSAWGDGTFGMQRDFPSVERQEAKKLYTKIVDGTTQAQMLAWGMNIA